MWFVSTLQRVGLALATRAQVAVNMRARVCAGWARLALLVWGNGHLLLFWHHNAGWSNFDHAAVMHDSRMCLTSVRGGRSGDTIAAGRVDRRGAVRNADGLAPIQRSTVPPLTTTSYHRAVGSHVVTTSGWLHGWRSLWE